MQRKRSHYQEDADVKEYIEKNTKPHQGAEWIRGATRKKMELELKKKSK